MEVSQGIKPVTQLTDRKKIKKWSRNLSPKIIIPEQQRVVPLLVAMVNLSKSELQVLCVGECMCVYICVREQVREREIETEYLN